MWVVRTAFAADTSNSVAPVEWTKLDTELKCDGAEIVGSAGDASSEEACGRLCQAAGNGDCAAFSVLIDSEGCRAETAASSRCLLWRSARCRSPWLAAAENDGGVGARCWRNFVLGRRAGCNTLRCPRGQSQRSDAANRTCRAGVCNDDDVAECCDEQHSCSTISCAEGRRPRAGRHYCATSQCTAADEALCCESSSSATASASSRRGNSLPQAACNVLACGDGWTLRKDSATSSCKGAICSPADDRQACCEEEEEDVVPARRLMSCSSVQCPAGWSKRSNAGQILCADAAECDPAQNPSKCCLSQATCNTFTCPSGYVEKANADTLHCGGAVCDSGQDLSVCCIAESSFATNSAGAVQMQNRATVVLPCTDPSVEQLFCTSTGLGLPVTHIEMDSFAVVFCPDQCLSQKVFGTGAYSMGSAVCTAGIHASVVSQGGGYVKVRVTAGLPSYVGSLQNGIVSQSAGSGIQSMVLSIPTAAEICAGGSPVTTTDMPWGWPWWAWFTLCASILALPLVAGLLVACLYTGDKEVKTKKRVDSEQDMLAVVIDDDPIDYNYAEEAPHQIVGGAVLPPLLHNYGDLSPRMPDTRGDVRSGGGRRPLALSG